MPDNGSINIVDGMTIVETPKANVPDDMTIEELLDRVYNQYNGKYVLIHVEEEDRYVFILDNEPVEVDVSPGVEAEEHDPEVYG